ncbi:hypothetical protein J3R82DRAFT_1596 [Butyriboletus roseoflavus]|nr:hypothetical protein J3R82DRAFT_1596 [Butyriboletus roseoflavus]
MAVTSTGIDLFPTFLCITITIATPPGRRFHDGHDASMRISSQPGPPLYPTLRKRYNFISCTLTSIRLELGPESESIPASPFDKKNVAPSPMSFPLSALTGIGPPSPSTSVIIEPRQIRIQDYPELLLLHLDIPTMGPRTLLTEETVHYPINGTLAELEWASLVPEGNHGIMTMGADARRSLGRRRPRWRGITPSTVSTTSDRWFSAAANTRLNPINHVLPSGKQASDGIGLIYECRDWGKVYEAFEANYALNRTMSFPQ